MGCRSISRGSYHRVSGLLEPGEIQHLERVAEWLGRPAWGVIVDEVRRQHGKRLINGKHRINKTRLLGDDSSWLVSANAGPVDQAMRAEDIRMMLQAIDELPMRQRRVVKMRLEGLTIPDIARRLGCSAHTVDFHMRKARKLLASA